GAVDAAADAALDPAEFLEDLLAVGDAAVHLGGRLAGQQQDGAPHHRRRLTLRIVEALDQLVIDGTRRRHDARRRHAADGDAVVLRDLLGQALGEALERRLAGAIHDAAAHGLVGVWAAPRADGGARADVDDGAAALGDHVR